MCYLCPMIISNWCIYSNNMSTSAKWHSSQQYECDCATVGLFTFLNLSVLTQRFALDLKGWVCGKVPHSVRSASPPNRRQQKETFKKKKNLKCFLKLSSLFHSVQQPNSAWLTDDVIKIIGCQVHQHFSIVANLCELFLLLSMLVWERAAPATATVLQHFWGYFGNMTFHTAQTSSQLIFICSTSVTSWFSNSTDAESAGNKLFPSLWPSTYSLSLPFSATDNGDVT